MCLYLSLNERAVVSRLIFLGFPPFLCLYWFLNRKKLNLNNSKQFPDNPCVALVPNRLTDGKVVGVLFGHPYLGKLNHRLKS